jgi:hypothetical protein
MPWMRDLRTGRMGAGASDKPVAAAVSLTEKASRFGMISQLNQLRSCLALYPRAQQRLRKCCSALASPRLRSARALAHSIHACLSSAGTRRARGGFCLSEDGDAAELERAACAERCRRRVRRGPYRGFAEREFADEFQTAQPSERSAA